MTNSFFSDNVSNKMFAASFLTSFKREKRIRSKRVDPAFGGADVMVEQVRKMLQAENQKLILMVRG